MSRSSAPDVGIITTGHDVADARLHKITAALQNRDLTVELWGLGEAAGGPAGAVVHAGPRGTMVHRLARTAVLPWRTNAKVVMTARLAVTDKEDDGTPSNGTTSSVTTIPR